MRQCYYNRSGHPIDSDEWIIQFGTIEARRIGWTDTRWFSVSTVFLGVDHQVGDGPPLLFETMVFARNNDDDNPPNDITERADYLCERYPTEDAAIAGHAAMTAAVIAEETTGDNLAVWLPRQANGD